MSYDYDDDAVEDLGLFDQDLADYDYEHVIFEVHVGEPNV